MKPAREQGSQFRPFAVDVHGALREGATAQAHGSFAAEFLSLQAAVAAGNPCCCVDGN